MFNLFFLNNIYFLRIYYANNLLKKQETTTLRNKVKYTDIVIYVHVRIFVYLWFLLQVQLIDDLFAKFIINIIISWTLNQKNIFKKIFINGRFLHGLIDKNVNIDFCWFICSYLSEFQLQRQFYRRTFKYKL